MSDYDTYRDTFTTRTEAMAAVAEAIEAGGAARADEYDLDAIIDDTHRFDEPTQRYVPAVDPDGFWAAVERHAR